MFTGLVQATGTLSSRRASGPGYRLTLATTLGPLELGESVSVSGSCLTVAELGAGWFAVDVSAESVARTIIGRVPIGAEVNLERALSFGDRLGGHLVTGHVDGLARVERLERVGEALRVTLEAPAELLPFVAAKGSVCLDGVSLTVNDLVSNGFEIMLIPHTLSATTLRDLSTGRELNMEVDLIARYVVRFLQASGTAATDKDRRLLEALARAEML
jgi:riboflavin synthase